MGQVVERKVNDWDDFESKLKEISSRRNELKKSSYCSPLLFRGQKEARWKLETTLERYVDGHMLLENYYRAILVAKPQLEPFTGQIWDIPLWKKYLDWLYNFDVSNVFEFDKLPAIEYMVYLRHHGFPSPLLDWTRSPYVAAFFAFDGIAGKEAEGDVAIYACLEWAGAGKSTSSNYPVMGSPKPRIKTHPRHYLQQSDYTICITKQEHEVSYASHEVIFSDGEKEQDLIWKLVIPKEQRLVFMDKLDSMNINAYSLYGSEESLMSTIALRELKLSQMRAGFHIP